MTVAMRPEDAKNWFGAMPPDLSVEARRAAATGCTRTCAVSTATIRGRPAGTTGVRERRHAACVVGAAGQRTAKFEDKTNEETGEKVHTLVGFQQVTPGTLSSPDYDTAVADLVAI
jgi:ubiquinol-cytochrome c reductase cytochrome c1 subunit